MKYGLLKTAYASEMRKLAAPRQIKELRRLLREGKLDEAREMSARLQEAGVLKNTDAGTFLVNPGEVGMNTPERAAQRNMKLQDIRRRRSQGAEVSDSELQYLRRKGRPGIAGGAEGIADVVVGAEDMPGMVGIRKTYDQQGKLYVPGQENRKVRVGEGLRGDSDFAQIYTTDRARRNPQGYGYMMKEYVPGIELQDAGLGDRIDANSFAEQAQMRANQKAGLFENVRDIYYEGGGAHGGNVMVGPDGKKKVVDFIVDDQKKLLKAQLSGDMRNYYPNLENMFDTDLTLKDADKRRVRESFGDGKAGSRQKKKVRGAVNPDQESFVDKMRKARATGASPTEARQAARQGVAAEFARERVGPGRARPRRTGARMPDLNKKGLSQISKKMLIGGALGLGGIGAGLAYKRYKNQQAAK